MIGTKPVFLVAEARDADEKAGLAALGVDGEVRVRLEDEGPDEEPEAPAQQLPQPELEAPAQQLPEEQVPVPAGAQEAPEIPKVDAPKGVPGPAGNMNMTMRRRSDTGDELVEAQQELKKARRHLQ